MNLRMTGGRVMAPIQLRKRMWFDSAWFARNSGAVQALVAVTSLGFTAALLWVSWKQTKISRKLSTLQQELAEADKPQIAGRVLFSTVLKSDRGWAIALHNKGRTATDIIDSEVVSIARDIQYSTEPSRIYALNGDATVAKELEFFPRFEPYGSGLFWIESVQREPVDAFWFRMRRPGGWDEIFLEGQNHLKPAGVRTEMSASGEGVVAPEGTLLRGKQRAAANISGP